VSSILDALRKIEAAAEPPVALPPVAARERRWTVHLVVGAVLLAFATGAGMALWIGMRPAPAPVKPLETVAAEVAPSPPAPVSPPPEPVPSRAAPPEAPVQQPAVEAPAVVTPPAVEAAPAPPTAPADATPTALAALPAAPPAPPPPRADLEADRPRGRVATAPDAPAPPAVASRAEPPSRAAEQPPPAAVAPEVEETPPPVPDPSLLPRLPADAPRVEVNVLLYSRLPERRTVSLTIAGGAMVTLREGESSGDFEVTRILPERIHVRYGGRMFAVEARN